MMRSYLLVLATLLTFGVCFAAAPEPPPVATTINLWQAPVRVVEVIDADTLKCDVALSPRIVLHGESLRIYGIDTPESTFRSTKNAREVEVGKLVKEVAALWVHTHGGRPYLTIDGESYNYAGQFTNDDKYSGRLGCHFYGRTSRGRVVSLGSYLIDNQLAFSYDGGTKLQWTKAALDQAEARALAILAEVSESDPSPAGTE